MKKILVVDDEKKIRHILQIILEQKGYRTDEAENGEAALKRLKTNNYALVITDIKMPVMDGMTLLREIKKIDPDYPVVVLTAFGSIESAVEAVREGAFDYITKPFEEDKLLMTVERSMRYSELVDVKKVLREELSEAFDFSNIVAESQEMLQILKQSSMVSRSPNTTVLVLGESGTGKELISRAIHFNSDRGSNKFVAINCAAISPNLVESELFGHEKGAFTGADRIKLGKFEVAHKGTVFLDEIGDLPPDTQAKLLRFLQEKEFERVGGTEMIKSDVRVICATNKDLKNLTDAGDFREDLYYRINVFPLHLPPLRERKKDILPLAEHFLGRCAESMGLQNVKISKEAQRTLVRFSWPGNIRELENAIERAVILSEGGTIGPEQFGFLDLKSEEGAGDGFRLSEEGISLEDMELDLARQALEISGNNQTEAARLLGLTRGKFRILVKRLKDEGA